MQSLTRLVDAIARSLKRLVPGLTAAGKQLVALLLNMMCATLSPASLSARARAPALVCLGTAVCLPCLSAVRVKHQRQSCQVRRSEELRRSPYTAVVRIALKLL